jgi:hypothetical protein
VSEFQAKVKDQFTKLYDSLVNVHPIVRNPITSTVTTLLFLLLHNSCPCTGPVLQHAHLEPLRFCETHAHLAHITTRVH